MNRVKDFFLKLYIDAVNLWEFLPQKIRIAIYDIVAATAAIAIVRLEALQVEGGEFVAIGVAAAIAFITWFVSEFKESAYNKLS